MMFKWSGLNRWNTNMNRASAMVWTDEIVEGSLKMAKAHRLLTKTRKAGTDMSEADALAAVGLDPRDASRLNNWGLNGDRSERLMKLLRAHATDRDGNRFTFWTAEAFEDFTSKHPIIPNFSLWSRKNAHISRIFTGAINSAVRDTITDPNILSRPFMNRWWIGRMFNQFQSFGYAWSNQTAVMASQRPLHHIAAYIPYALFAGGVTDAIHQHLNGKRTFEETAGLWRSNPMAMLYASLERSQLLGFLQRPIGMAGSWIGPLVSEHYRESLAAAKHGGISGLGPAIGYWDRVIRNIGRGYVAAASPYQDVSPGLKKSFLNITPYNNLLALSALYRITSDIGLKNPFGRGTGWDVFGGIRAEYEHKYGLGGRRGEEARP